MLGSITPLGERGRNARWGVTMAWFAVGAIAAGALVGALLGALGGGVLAVTGVGPAGAAWVLGALAALAAVTDVWLGGRSAPSPHRQVDERWLRAYRPWVYGSGFGFQLGLGVATIVTTAAVYATLAAAALTGSPLGGAAVGAVFGAARAASLAPARGVRAPADLVRVDAMLRRLEPRAARAALLGQAAVAVAALALGGAA